MSRPLRVGVQLPEVEREVRWPEYLALARAAEAVGFDSIWLGDHLLYRDDGRPERGPWDAWTLLAALAGVTERVVLGPLVACLAFHPPGLIARMASAIDEISGGRFVLGVGSGWNEAEFRAFGLPFDQRASRFIEGFEIVRRLVAGEHVTSEGTFWQVEDAVLLPPPARTIPIMLGTSGPRQLAATLPYATAGTAGGTPTATRRRDSPPNTGISAIASGAGLRSRVGRAQRLRARLLDLAGAGAPHAEASADLGQRGSHRRRAARSRRGRRRRGDPRARPDRRA